MKLQKLLFLIIILSSSIVMNAQNLIGDKEEINSILENVKQFSNNVMESNYENIGLAYTIDAKIFPNNVDIIEGRTNIVAYWTPSNGSRIKYHKITPEEIKVIGNEAYDYGYYEGISVTKDGNESEWKGKYVIIWKKVEGQWKMYLDIWNRNNN